MPNPFGMFGSDAGSPSSTPATRSVSPAPGAAVATAAAAAPAGSAVPTSQLRSAASHGRLSKLMIGRPRSASVASQEATPVVVTAHADDSASGRATPEQRRRTARVAAASLLASDGRYKKYAAQVDRCLQAFESVNEWADFISFLSRLLKTMQTPSPAYTEVPRKLIVAKRLAQCLNPALPSGVHTKALEVYDFVFSAIGVEGLKRDILIWSSGIFPFFQYASTAVRPALLDIYEKYYLPVGEDLRPATKALILALLPGLEEETGDFFDQVLGLLTKFSAAVGSEFFFQNVFLVLISSAASRLAAINFLARKLSEPPEDVSKIDVGLVTRGVAAALGDRNMLVRRGGLDLLLRVLPLSGVIFQQATQEDRKHLVRAVSAVVLQRDVSLSRRVYAWFLGTDESAEKQTAYFQANGLELLAATLQNDMDKAATASDWPEAQAAFKVFLSLLDKWELGESLSQRLAISSLQSIRNAASGDRVNEVVGTGVAVYEAIEPSVLWKQLHRALDQEFPRGKSEHLKFIQWLFSTIPQHEEETVTVYLPIILHRILRGVEKEAAGADSSVRSDALETARPILAAIPDQVFSVKQAERLQANGDSPSIEELAYANSPRLEEASAQVRSQLAPAIVTNIFGICDKALSKAKWSPQDDLLITHLAFSLIDREVPTLSLVDGQRWLTAVLSALERVRSFAVVDALVDAVLNARRSRVFKSPINVTDDRVMSAVLDALFRYLRLGAAPYHARAVELLWEYNQLAEVYTLESVISRRMSSVTGKTEAFEAFGVLWRLSDDSMLPGEIFQVPMMMVLDGLKSENPQVLRASETWMRCNLRSYFRMLDPLLRRLLEMVKKDQLNGHSTSDDSSLVFYYVSSMCSLFRFGGQGLSKACQSAEMSKSPNALFSTRAEEAFPEVTTYLELLVALLTTFLEDSANIQLAMRTQSASLELLQLLVSRGDLSVKCLDHIRTTLVTKITFATQHRRLTLQNTMLHLLHLTISACGEAYMRSRGHRAISSTFSMSEKSNNDGAAEFDAALVNMIITGVSSPGNRPVLQHWIDFVLMIVPNLEHKRSQLRELCDCFCEQLRMTMLQVRNTFAVSTVEDKATTITEAEPIMLIGVLERLAMAIPAKGGLRKSDERERQNSDGGGLLGYLPTVFSVEAPQDDRAKSEAARYLDEIVEALLVTWTVTMDSEYEDEDDRPCAASKTQILSRTRVRARKALEKMFKAQPSEILGSCVQVWAAQANDISDAALFDCIDVLAPSAQKVVDLACEHLTGKGRGSITESSNFALLAFLEAYISRLEGPIAVQVWNSQYGYARDILGQSSILSARMQLFPILKCLTTLGKIVSTTSALEDRRLRKDLHDTYVKVLDAVVSSASRLGDSAVWQRGGAAEAVSSEGEKISPEPRGQETIFTYIGDVVLHNLRTFLVDNDRVASACASVSSNIVVPAFKHQRVDSVILKLLREMTKIPVAVKAWRLPVGDAFNDNRFFKIKPEESSMWKPLVHALMDSEKERLGDLLGRIAAAPSANIFTNREAETISRSLNLRRLSVVMLAGGRNHYLPQLPSIQEKLVEILRNTVVSPRVHSEVYLCLRVLMCRFSPQHLANFWPVILTELLRVFEATMDEPPADGSESLLLVLAACKFLDLLLVIQSEDFQIHQWMFVTDTTDAAYPPEDHSPEAIIDRLAEILAENAGPPKTPTDFEIPREDSNSLRKPHLAGVKSLTSLQQLQPFFARASIDTFEGVYSDTGVDWEAVEVGLNGEIFEGGGE